MRNFKRWMILSSFLLMGFSTQGARLTVQVLNLSRPSVVNLSLADGQSYQIKPDNKGYGQIELPLTQATYVQLEWGYVNRTLWLRPQSEVTVSFDEKEFYKQVKTMGSESEVNNYLNNGALLTATINESGVPEAAYLQRVDSMLCKNRMVLKAANLPADFVSQEERRLLYYTYQELASYPEFYYRMTRDTTYHASMAYWRKLSDLVQFDDANMSLIEYQNFLKKSVPVLGQQEAKLSASQSDKRIRTTDAALRYIQNQAGTQTQTAEYLYYQTIYSFVDRQGLDAADEYLALFDKHVHRPLLKERFEALCNRWMKIKKGNPSPTFVATNTKGETVTLESLKGQYLYIDIWATWCVPCRKEAPYLTRLEEEFGGKGICFVSLSCDKDRKAWERMVAEKQMKGVQLILDEKDNFMNDYMVKGIPRFILLDKNGQILNRNMSRPSEPATTEYIKQLISK